jgi:hypothetical protein
MADDAKAGSHETTSPPAGGKAEAGAERGQVCTAPGDARRHAGSPVGASDCEVRKTYRQLWVSPLLKDA